MDYFAASITLTLSTPGRLVDSSTKDRIVYINGGDLKIGFTSTTAVFDHGSLVNPISLPAGEELWGVSPSTPVHQVLVAKSPSSVTLCG